MPKADMPNTIEHRAKVWTQRILVGCLISVVGNGCAYRNEGAIDFRKSDIATGTGTESIGQDFIESIQLGTVFGLEAGEKVPSRNYQGEEVRLVPLTRKNVSSPAPKSRFTAQDSVSIRLKGAYIGYYSEGAFSYVGDLITEGQYISRGEIAVVVDVFQLGEAKRTFDFSDKAIKNGRVVYFSKDVESGQFLNFNNMPVYGPVTYKAGPMAFDFGVMELDISDQVTMELLSKLAALGAQAFPAAAPELKILSSFGESLVQKDTNDINARYTLLFDTPEGGYPDLPRSTLEVGNYVFIRSENRQSDLNWEDLLLDENTGKLYIKIFEPYPENIDVHNKSMVGVDYRRRNYITAPYKINNYFTFQVNKNESAIHIDIPNYDYSTLLEELNKSSVDDSTRLSKALTPVTELVKTRTQLALFDEIRSHTGTLRQIRVKYLKAKNLSSSLSRTTFQKYSVSNLEELTAKSNLQDDQLKIFRTEAISAAKGANSRDATKEIKEKAKTKQTELESQQIKTDKIKLDITRLKAARVDLTKKEGELIRQFQNVWSLFEPTLIDDSMSPPTSSRCALITDKTDSGGKTRLEEKQCSYVLANLENIAGLTNTQALSNFQVESQKSKADRKVAICKLLFDDQNTPCGA